MQKLVLLLSIFFGVTSYSHAQILVSYTHINDLSVAQVDSIIGESGPNGVSIFSLVYTLLDHNNELDTVSGLVCLPIDQTMESNVVIYNHGTSNDPQDVPSTLRSGFQESLAFASFGFAVGAPDYIGEGISESFHPYIHAETEALAGLYLIDQVYAIMEDEELTAGPSLFVSGYSQGGHASMALQKKIETEFSNDIDLTAAAHGSGPYSISHVMRELIAFQELYISTGFVPYFIIGYQEAYGNIYENLVDIFKPQFVPVIEQFETGQIDITALSIEIGRLLFFSGSSVAPKYILQDSILNKLITNDPNEPLIQVLRENDVYNFTANVPTRLYYCEADDIVPFENSIFADSAMQALGAADLQLVHVDPNGSHGTCAVQAIPMAIDFFLSFTNVGNVEHDLSLIDKMYPNPVIDELIIELKSDTEKVTAFISGMDGKQWSSFVLEGPYSTIDVANLPQGMYFLTLRQSDGFQSIKFLK